MKTLFDGESKGCPICQDTHPPVETSTAPDGTQVRIQKCGLCGEIWAIQKLTLDQAIILDTQAETVVMLRDLAAALDLDAEEGAYGKVMQEISTRHSPQVVDHLKAAFRELAKQVQDSHLAELTEPTYQPGNN